MVSARTAEPRGPEKSKVPINAQTGEVGTGTTHMSGNSVNDSGALMAVRGVDFLSVIFLVEADRVTGGAKFSETFGNAG